MMTLETKKNSAAETGKKFFHVTLPLKLIHALLPLQLGTISMGALIFPCLMQIISCFAASATQSGVTPLILQVSHIL